MKQHQDLSHRFFKKNTQKKHFTFTTLFLFIQSGNTPLHEAVKKNFLFLVDLLLEKGPKSVYFEKVIFFLS